MLNHERSLTTYDNTLLNKIASQVCQVIITIHRQQPELLLEKYRKVQWQNNSNQSALIAKFTELLSQAHNWDELLKKLQLSLKALLIPAALDLPILSDLIANIRQQNPLISEFNGSLIPNSITSLLPVGIAVLLLDAENLQINTQTEKFLANVCNCPLQVKIAFANWSNRGKLDIELHERGYDLIHVPAGRDNADGKMIAFGSSIHELYPHAKEVLVCSSDKVMTNLCNNLQQHGLIVYQVSQHSENINLFNNSTGETTIYSIKPLVEIPSIEQFILQVKGLIKEEQKLTTSVWVKLSHLAKIYKVKHQLHLSHIVAKYSPNKNAKDIFAKYPADLVIHQIDDNSELYVTVFDDNLNSGRNQTDKSESIKNIPSSSLTRINSKLDLELALKMILEDLMKESTQVDFDISILAIQFKQRYGKPISEQIKELKINGSYIKFLQSCSFFQLKQKDNKWEISALNLTNTKSNLLSDINSPAALEEAIKNILTIATNELGNGYIDISILGTKFHQQYGKSITDQLKALKIGGNYMKFLQSSSSFQLKQTGNKWEVAIR
ncbi:NYN domain-containing protein [Anabaena azotica]|uniref:NYN domain-containing protein n=1 Tax=Anabaena azotica TaxID=197653 RepID=UPI0039A47E31